MFFEWLVSTPFPPLEKVRREKVNRERAGVGSTGTKEFTMALFVFASLGHAARYRQLATHKPVVIRPSSPTTKTTLTTWCE